MNEDSGRDDRDAAEGVRHQQVPVAADDEFGMAVDREFEDMSSVGPRQATIRSPIGISSAAASILITPSQIRGRYPGDVGPAQNIEKLPFGRSGFAQTAMPVDPPDDVVRKRIRLERGADENIGVDDQPHPAGGSTSCCARLINRSMSSSLRPASIAARLSTGAKPNRSALHSVGVGSGALDSEASH